MREEEHCIDLSWGLLQQAGEDQQADGLVTSDLSWRGWENVEHVVDGIAEDGCAEGDLVANGPEGEHGEEAIEEHGDTGEQEGGNKDSGLAGTCEQGVNESCGESFDLAADALREQSGDFGE